VIAVGVKSLLNTVGVGKATQHARVIVLAQGISIAESTNGLQKTLRRMVPKFFRGIVCYRGTFCAPLWNMKIAIDYS
jgi:hypothetical protein